MLKQSLIYLILSFTLLFFATYAKLFFVYVNIIYSYINLGLENLFGSSFGGELVRDIITLMLVPLILAGLPALIYWLIKRKTMPYFLELLWLFWLILAISSYLIG